MEEEAKADEEERDTRLQPEGRRARCFIRPLTRRLVKKQGLQIQVADAMKLRILPYIHLSSAITDTKRPSNCICYGQIIVTNKGS